MGQQLWSKCDEVDDLNFDCTQCGKRTHVFWYQEPVGKLVDYLRHPDHFEITYVISHNYRGHDAQFLLRKFLEQRWTPQMIKDGTKIISMIVDFLYF